MSKSVTRLFAQFRPKTYRLELDVDAENLTFTGVVTITGQKHGRPSQRLTFHQRDLKITSAHVTHHGKKDTQDVPIDRINTQNKLHEVRLHSPAMLYPGEYTIVMKFNGRITEHMNGMYPCHFTHGGKRKTIIATQFESHHAREVFPCIDEPEAKATFDLQLTSPAGQPALSNMPIASETTTGERKTTVFETSPRMSSYLLAFAFGDIHCVEGKTEGGVAIRTWGSTAQPKKFLSYANDEAIRVLDFFESYFDTPFPLEKCDQLALPDFDSGAMENWGLITYREIALLADPDNRSLSGEQYVSMVVAHELSHQWFGNLVTMKWWDDLWLNESFASLMEHVALDALHPEWRQWESYVTSDVLSCSNRDIYQEVQPVRVDVRHPDEISTLFDPAIVYSKGGHLLRMLMDYIGEAAFRAGLKAYFAKHAYSNTVGNDLWAALGEASGKDIKSFMNPWLEQSGSPLLTVTRPTEDVLYLTQERFLLDGEDKQSQWSIPLLASKPLPVETLDARSAEVPYAQPTPIFNAAAAGHYLVEYGDDADQERVNHAVATRSIPAESRMNILNDMSLLVRRGDKSAVDLLQLVRQCADEDREAVWALLNRAIGFAAQLTEGNDDADQSLKIIQYQLANTWHKKLGWEDQDSDDPNTKHLRQTMLSLMVGAEDAGALKTAVQKFDAAKTLDSLPSEQRGLIIGAKVRHDPDVDIDALLEAYKASHNPDVQMAIATGLSRSKNPDTIAHIIESAIGPDGFVRPQDVFRWFAYLMRSRYTREAAWNWLITSWDRLETAFGSSKSFDYFVVYAAMPINTPEWEQRFHQFFETKLGNILLTRNIKIAYKEIAARVDWRKRDEAELLTYLKTSVN
ncbi:M1 family peptidase [Patescibacteria group bacterium]|nr:MAG: M1 family peptidase [Patescibacteria group bacterium]